MALLCAMLFYMIPHIAAGLDFDEKRSSPPAANASREHLFHRWTLWELCEDAHGAARARGVPELDIAIDQGEERVVAANANAVAGLDLMMLPAVTN